LGSFVAVVLAAASLSTNWAHSDEKIVLRADPIRVTRTARQAAAAHPRDDRNGEVNPRDTRAPSRRVTAQSEEDAAVRASTSTRAPVADVDVKGIGFTGVVPPDTVGDAGPTQYVQMTNSSAGTRVAIFDKTDGSQIVAFTLDDLAPSGDCRFGAGDPIVLFDQLAGRWLFTEFVNPNVSNTVCIYVSDTSDAATTTWSLYAFGFGPYFPDYPKYAVWPDAYLMGFNNDDLGAPVVAFDRLAMLAGDPALGFVELPPELPGFGFQLLTPVDAEGATAPPAGSPGVFVRHVDDEAHDVLPDATKDFLEVWEMSYDFVAETSSVSKVLDVEVEEFSSHLCGFFSFSCIKQKGTKRKLDPLREPVMHRPMVRRFGTHQSLVATWSVDADGNERAGVRWVELRRAEAATTGGWSVFQQQTYFPDKKSRWMPSVAMNGDGDIALGYSISSRRIYPRIGVTGRLVGDPPGTMPQGEVVTAKSAGPQTFANRWGDYSAMSVDPTDDETFWYTNEYLNRRGLWRTRITSFTLN
jgi:hypothetical protein